MVHDMYLAEVRKPGEVADSYDVFKILATVKSDEAFPPLEASACPMVTAKK